MADYITVAQLNRMARQVLEGCEALAQVVVCGEVSGFVRHHKSGHCYFSLRDAQASVKCVMFRDKARLLGFGPQDGMQVLAYGRATLYERDGAFQVYVEYMRPFGAGAAQMAFDALKAKLEAQGLLDPARKRPLPAIPGCIGIVTSKDGAALQDVCNVMARRWPLTRLLLAPANVQGAEAEQSIVAGIRALDADERPDLILVTRGGGSREDLWVFNSERIARAVCACRKPVVSAVGHEVDYTILDYVADLRAPTPSAAAELCVPDGAHLRAQLAQTRQKFQNAIQSCYRIWYNKTLEIRRAPAIAAPYTALQARAQALAQAQEALGQAAVALLREKGRALGQAAALCDTLDPCRILARGYAIVEDAAGAPVQVADLRPGQQITVRDARAWAACRVEQAGQQKEEPHAERQTQKL